MYSVGQQVVYGSHGVCAIVDLEEKIVDKKAIAYFVLSPMENPATRYYLPSQNPSALAKIRPLAEASYLRECWTGALDETVWIPQENRRKMAYRELINNADPAVLITMVRCLHRYKKDLLAAGKKFHLADDNFLRDARRILIGEMCVVLQIEQPAALSFIEDALETM